MSRFCTKCGALALGQFCPRCGNPMPQEQPATQPPAQPQPIRCPACGEEIGAGKRFCRKCGAQVAGAAPAPQPAPIRAVPPRQQDPAQAVPAQHTPQAKPTSPAQGMPVPQGVQGAVTQVRQAAQAVGAVARLGGDILAPATGGELSFDLTLPAPGGAASGVMTAVGTGKTLLGGLTGVFRGFAGAFQNPKALITALVLGALWLAQTLLPALGVQLPEDAARVLGFLTFAQGGLQGGLAGTVGGVIGKGVLAGCAASLLGGGAFRQIGSGMKAMFSSFSCKSGREAGLLLCGMGAALMGGNFMAGDAGLSGGMAAISAMLLSLRAMGSRAGFLRQLAGSLVSRAGTAVDMGLAGRLMGGLSAGFALALPISALPFGFACYLLGGLLLIGGVVLALAGKGR